MLTHPNVLEDVDATENISSVEGVVEARHGVPPCVGYLLHLRQFIRAAGREIQEREPIEVFRLLVGLLDNLTSATLRFGRSSERRSSIPCDSLVSKPVELRVPSILVCR